LNGRPKIRARGVVVASLALACLAPAAYASSLEQVSIGPNSTGNTAIWSSFDGASADGTRIFFDTAESLTSNDTDGYPDIYERSDGTTTLISIGPDGGNGQNEVTFRAASDDGAHVFFQTGEALVAADTDQRCYDQAELYVSCSDVYERTGNTTNFVSTGPTASNGSFQARLRGISRDGLHAFFSTEEQLVAADTDSAFDVYERTGGTTRLVSTGPAGGNADTPAVFKGCSDDGSRVFIETEEPLTSADTDSQGDIYERTNGSTTTLLSTGTTGGNGAFASSFKGSSSDGSRVFFETDEQLVSGDTDSNVDVYQRSSGTTTLLSTGPTGGNGAKDSFFAGQTPDGTHVWIETNESLVAADTDTSQDVYDHSGGTTTLVSTGPSGGNGTFDASFQHGSDDGSRVLIGTLEKLAPTDTDSAFDVYERSGGTTIQMSLGPLGGNSSFDSLYAGASADGTRVFFETDESLVSADADSSYTDVYQRYGGTTTLLSTGPSGTTTSDTNFAGSAEDGTRVFLESGDQLLSSDTDTQKDVYVSVDINGYPRPKGATPFSVPLVIAYRDCTVPNSVHGPPLSDPSCKPPVAESSWLTVGTPDSNGLPVKSVGFARLSTIVGDSSTPADEADLKVELSDTDVRNTSDVSDYAGELQLKLNVRITDKTNGSVPVDPATVSDIPLTYTAACATTSDTTVGSTCTLDTTADAVVPGTIVEGKRAIWQVGTVEVWDGGSDGDVDTAPNTLFERQGVFVP
jgi:hypothetical protein